MTGQEFAKLKESQAFRQVTMDSVINEFTPPTDAFRLTEAFLPFKLVDKSVLMDLIQHGAFGRTNPIALGADHKQVALPGHTYKEHTSGHWRESIKFGEDVLLKAANPQLPLERWGDGLVTAALNVLDLRLNNLIEYVTSKILIDGSYSEARYGINYTYDPKIPAKYYLDVTSVPGWPTGGTWATAANAKPIADVIGAKQAMQRMGLNAEAAIMSVATMELYYNATDTKTMVQASPALIDRSADRNAVFDTLTGLKSEIDNRLYAEEAVLTAPSLAADTTIEVDNASEFTAGDIVTLRNSVGEEEDRTIDSIASNIITLTAGVGNAYVLGDRITVYKQFLPDGYVLIKATPNDRIAPNNWISTPSLIKGSSWTAPLPGRYTWNYFNEKVPYWVEVGAGIDGGPKVSRCTWVRLKVIA